MTTEVLLQGRYRLEQPLGSGAMGTVVLARDTVLERRVAVKVLASHLAADNAFRERFVREARLAARLCHPSIVQVFDAGDDPTPFLVMEYVDGETVADRLARGQRFSGPELVSLATGLSSGLAHAHALGVVHRDVKPHNVLITRDGLAKLTDFGIARAVEDRGLTEIGTVLGTARFMAPEQASGQPVGPAADVFALGAVLRYAAGEGADASLPPALRSLVDAAAAADPTDRPAAAEFYGRLTARDDAPTQVAIPAPTMLAPAERPAAATQREQQPWSRPSLVAPVTAALIIVILMLALLPRGAADHPSDASRVTPVPEAPSAAESARNLAVWLRDQAN